MSSTCCKSSNISISPHHHDPTGARVVPITARSNPDPRFPRAVKSGGGAREVTVVDCKSCRQLYLRSAYTFSREKESKGNNSVKEMAKKWLSRVKDRVALAKGFSSASLFSILGRILACTSTSKVNVISRR